MTRTLTTIGAADRVDTYQSVVDAINAEFEDRNLFGDLDGMDMSFDVCVADAVAKLHGTWDVQGENYYVALDGAPLTEIMP